MNFGINTIDDFDIKGKTVLCRIDINEPVDKKTGEIKDITRIKGCAGTIRELSDKGAKVVLLAHQGSDIEYKNFYTTEHHAPELEKCVGKPVQFIDDVCGPEARKRIMALSDGDILLLDNVRFVAEEQTLFEKKLKLTHAEQADTLLVRKLAPLADLYLCDAFAAAHRDQPSLCGFEEVLPSAMGRLFEKEYVIVSGIMAAPERPCTFVLGGAKIADAFTMMTAVLENGAADQVLLGGLAGNIMLAAAGEEIGSGSSEFIVKSGYEEYIKKGKDTLEKYGEKIMMPKDLAYVRDGKRMEAETGSVPADITSTDIGRKTAEEYGKMIRGSKTVFVNGPMGVFEEEITEYGTKSVWNALADTSAFTVIGGGDSITATKKYGKTDDISYICTGGGSLIRFLSGEELPVVRALRHAAEKFGSDKT